MFVRIGMLYANGEQIIDRPFLKMLTPDLCMTPTVFFEGRTAKRHEGEVSVWHNMQLDDGRQLMLVFKISNGENEPAVKEL